jgi:hypothetical protein
LGGKYGALGGFFSLGGPDDDDGDEEEDNVPVAPKF